MPLAVISGGEFSHPKVLYEKKMSWIANCFNKIIINYERIFMNL
jgi:hypothetical protein